MNQTFALIDCNNFFVSCERVFNPKLIGKPVVVLSNNDGCIISRSNEAKALGIPMGAPLFKWQSVISRHNVFVFSSNFSLYGDLSKRVMRTIKELSPSMEVYSIDEAFIDLTQFNRFNLLEHCQKIRQTIMQWTGIPVSIGIGPTKTLAKVANELAKKNENMEGVLDLSSYFKKSDYQKEQKLPTAHILEILSRVPVGDIWGVGRNLEPFLHSFGIQTAADLVAQNDKWILKNLTVTGLRMVHELRGTACISLDETREAPKTILSSRSFGRPVTSLTELKEAIASYVQRASEKLREEKLLCSDVTLYIVTNYFKPEEPQYKNSYTIHMTPTDYTPTMVTAALSGLDKIYQSGYKYRKAGVVLSKFTPASMYQIPLLEEADTEKQTRVIKAFDAINREWGSNTVQFAAQGIQKPWKMKSAKKSKRFTTKWDEIPTISIH